MNKKFENPELIIVRFINNDIIMTSYNPFGSNPGDAFEGSDEPNIPGEGGN